MLSMGGRILVEKNASRKTVSADFVNRDGWFLDGYGVKEFEELRRKRLIVSNSGAPYRIARAGVEALMLSRQSAAKTK